VEQEAEIQRLRDENDELKKKISDFSVVENAKKKLQLKVEHLEQKVGLVKFAFKQLTALVQMDTMIHEKVSQKANELTATYDEKLRNYEDRYLPLFFVKTAS
jgi:homeobox protein cut-like